MRKNHFLRPNFLNAKNNLFCPDRLGTTSWTTIFAKTGSGQTLFCQGRLGAVTGKENSKNDYRCRSYREMQELDKKIDFSAVRKVKLLIGYIYIVTNSVATGINRSQP
eukprot:COSAG06_NODE_1917_length_8070_cov_51.606323_5_plen_108_part_00